MECWRSVIIACNFASEIILLVLERLNLCGKKASMNSSALFNFALALSLQSFWSYFSIDLQLFLH